MKNQLNNITSEEKQRILEMYKKNTPINESTDLNVRVKDGNLSINGIEYGLEVKLLLVWKKAKVQKVNSTDGKYTITASALGKTQSLEVDPKYISKIEKNLGKDEIELGGKLEKRLIKV